MVYCIPRLVCNKEYACVLRSTYIHKDLFPHFESCAQNMYMHVYMHGHIHATIITTSKCSHTTKAKFPLNIIYTCVHTRMYVTTA